MKRWDCTDHKYYHECDECGTDKKKIYSYVNNELCIDCISDKHRKANTPVLKCNDCGSDNCVLYYRVLEDVWLCKKCLAKKYREVRTKW